MKKIAFSLLMLALLGGSSVFGQSVSFDIRNEQASNGTYEFDVYMAADQNGTYHSRGQVYIAYNPAAFGDQVVARNRVSVQPLSLLDQTTQVGDKYTTLNVADNGHRIALTWQSNFLNVPQASTTLHTEVPTHMTPLYHVSVQLKDASKPTELQFDNRLMKGQQFMLLGSFQERAYGDELSLGANELLALEANRINDHDVRLEWRMKQEFNNDFFVVEKKRNNGEFVEIGRVGSEGNTEVERSYAYLDESGMSNENWYRVKQVSLDGTSQYTNEVFVGFEYTENQSFTVFPSPATTQVTVKAAGRMDNDYTFTVSDAAGKTVVEGTVAQAAGEETLDIRSLAAGQYFMRISDGVEKHYLARFTKVDN